MLSESTLLAAEGIPSQQPQNSGTVAGLGFPSAVAIDLKPGTTSVQRARLVNQIVSANPTGFPGGTYQLTGAQALAVINAQHMGGQPLALALGLAAAASRLLREMAQGRGNAVHLHLSGSSAESTITPPTQWITSVLM
jgi:hypothetical protein